MKNLITHACLSFSFSCVSESQGDFRTHVLFSVCLFVIQVLPSTYILSFYILRSTFVTCKFLTLMLSLIKKQDLMHFLLCFWSDSPG